MTSHPENPNGALDLVLRAAVFAGRAHGPQTRKASDQPYINHLLRVSQQAAAAGLPPEVVAAALLHDVAEDTTTSLEMIRGAFPERVARLVELLTKWWPDDAGDEVKATEKPRYYGAIIQDPDAVALKLLDRADNLNEMAAMVSRIRRWAERYLQKTEAEFAAILAACTNPSIRGTYLTAIENLRSALARA